jgi:hypothetical protein
MKWIKFSERWPKMEAEWDGLTDKVMVRSPALKQEREAMWHPTMQFWMLSDCTHPIQNCHFSTLNAEWLED